jgi:inward rectifier potassium channel
VSGHHERPPRQLPNLVHARPGQRVAIVKGQDQSRWTDIYHGVLTAPWWLFFLGLLGFFVAVNLIFALLYLADPAGLAHSRHGNFWDVFLFSFETIASINYTGFVPQTTYANIIVSIEGFSGILTTALFTGVLFARFSRPFARIVFSNCAVITQFDGVPTLMFRTANQRGNSILDAEIKLSLAHQQTSREGIVMRRFEDLKPARQRSSLFATTQMLYDQQIEIIAMLSGVDETLADRVYARHAYGPDDIVWGRRFVDVISLTPQGRRMVDLTRFHDTEAC